MSMPSSPITPDSDRVDLDKSLSGVPTLMIRV